METGVHPYASTMHAAERDTTMTIHDSDCVVLDDAMMLAQAAAIREEHFCQAYVQHARAYYGDHAATITVVFQARDDDADGATEIQIESLMVCDRSGTVLACTSAQAQRSEPAARAALPVPETWGTETFVVNAPLPPRPFARVYGVRQDDG